LQVVLEVFELVLDRVNSPVKPGLNGITEPRHHGINDRSLNVVADDLHATPVGLELVAQPIDYPRDDRPRSIAKPIHHSWDCQLNGEPNNLHVQVIALKV